MIRTFQFWNPVTGERDGRKLTVPLPNMDFERDTRYGRPYVHAKGQTKRTTYTRCTTFISALDDTYNLEAWKKRMVVAGLVTRPDLIQRATSADDKADLNAVIEEAFRAGGGEDAASYGTMLHTLTETLDRGQSLPDGISEAVQESLDTYQRLTKDWKHVLIEQPVVSDFLKVAGTPDRVVEIGKERFIADLKTGSHLDPLKIGMQLGIYARSDAYIPDTGEHFAHGASIDKGLVIHLPKDKPGEGAVYWIDLAAAWPYVNLCRQVREARRVGKGWFTEYGSDEEPPDLLEAIATATGPEILKSLWSENREVWTEAHSSAVEERLAVLAND